MRIELLYDENRYNLIPDFGYILAFCCDKIFFSKYQKKNGKIIFENYSDFLDIEFGQIHLFDDKTEYRMVSINNGNDFIETQVFEHEENDMDDDLLYYDEMIIDENFSSVGLEKLYVINRYKYSDQNTLVLDNYRLSSK